MGNEDHSTRTSSMPKTPDFPLHLDKNYALFFADLKERLSQTQVRIATTVNTEIIRFYWRLGKDILALQATHHWGSNFIEQLSKDIQTSNPGMSGFSKRSLEYMRLLASTFPSEEEFTQQPAAQLPWSHIQILLDRFKNQKAELT